MKRIILTLLLPVLLPVGCAKNEITEVNISARDVVGFATTTLRSAVVGLGTMQNDGAGFRVYAVSNSSPSNWYNDGAGGVIDGSNNYRYAGSWGWTGQAPKWPASLNDYPMTFYALYPAAPAGLTLSPAATSPSLFQFTYQVQAENNQVDLLAAKATANLKPASGKLPLTFRHLLSKINFGVTTGQGTAAYVQALGIFNVGDKRTCDFIATNWTAAQPTLYDANYTYYGVFPPNPTGNMTILAPQPFSTPATAVSESADPFYGNLHDKHLMLMPQTAVAWSPAPGAAPANAYICVVYRLEVQNNPNAVGWADAATHPGYTGSALEQQGYTGPLYVKAGFPLPTTAGNSFTWEMGLGYTYHIGLGTAGSCNGYIVDTYYYDKYGNRTGLEIGNGKKTGDKIQDGYIRVTLDVTDWDSLPGVEITVP
jgi:hypothetical protein